MEKNFETNEEKAAAILAGLSMNERDLIVTMIKEEHIILYVEGRGHYKWVVAYRNKPFDVCITFEDLEFLISYMVLDNVHASYRINFDKVMSYSVVDRDVFAKMSDKKNIPISRTLAKAFKRKCKDHGILKEKKTENGPNVK